MKKYFAIVVGITVLLGVFAYFQTSFSNFFASIAAPFFAERIIPEALRDRYDSGNLRVLIVPGHDTLSSGTEYRGVKEAEINLSLAYYLTQFLQKDSSIEVFALRKRDGTYSDWFEAYRKQERTAIVQFRDSVRGIMQYAIGREEVKKEIPKVRHNPAADNVSIDLYGINKLSNENNMDIVLHVHFNDYPRRNLGSFGKYSGFSIYVPESQFPNARASREIAEAIKSALQWHVPKSNFPGEADTIIETQELIAVGSNASRDGVSILIEYSYIYESQLRDRLTREAVLKELAYQTSVALSAYFDSNNKEGDEEDFNTTLLPYTWYTPLRSKDRGIEVLALQYALHAEGLYPPAGSSLTECPLSSYYGSCTSRAVNAFQKKYTSQILKPLGLRQATGIVGSKTIRVLNELYGQ